MEGKLIEALGALGFVGAERFAYGAHAYIERDEVVYSVRLPRGADDMSKLIFEIGPEKRGSKLLAEARLDVDVRDPGWFEKVQAWMVLEHPAAKERALARERALVERETYRELIRTTCAQVRDNLSAAGLGGTHFVILGDNKTLRGARIEVEVSGTSAEEITAGILALLLPDRLKGTEPWPDGIPSM